MAILINYLNHTKKIAFLIAIITTSSLFTITYTKNLQNKVDDTINLLLEKQSIFDEQMYLLQRRYQLLRDIISVEDAFEKDELILEHAQLAARFMALRHKLEALPLSPEERRLLEQQIKSTRMGYNVQDDLINKSIEETRPEHYRELLNKVYPVTETVYASIHNYKKFMEKTTRDTISSAQLNYENGWHFIFTIYIFIVCAIIAIFIWAATKKKKYHLELEWKATHDNLTHLCNRGEFERILKNTIDYHDRNSVNSIIYIDLDEFKVVNDSCGHMAGDLLLKEVSNIIKSNVRTHDVVARLGGDEFGLLLMGCYQSEAVKVAELICKKVHEYGFVWEGNTYKISTSIGAMEIDDSTANINEILRRVDTVCYTAKTSGKNRVHAFSYDDESTIRRIAEIEQADNIRSALRENRFVLYRQRYKNLKPNLPPACEILVRMLDKSGKVILPDQFIPAATRFHLMHEIDKWVLINTLDYLSSLPDDNTIFNINLSNQMINDEECHDFIIENIQNYNLDASRICFEITEDSAIANLDKTVDFMERLRKMGCGFALDDFGTGLSSFTYLQQLPVDTLKIDGSFVINLSATSYEHTFIEAISSISKSLDIHIVAEWVESQEVLDQLVTLEVDYAQGHLIEYAEPLIPCTKQLRSTG